MFNKRSLALIGSLLFAAACPDDEPTGTTDEPAPTCATVDNPYPAPDAQNVYYRATFSWDFSAEDTSVSVDLVDDAGNTVSGSGSWVGQTYIWQPGTELTPETTYTVTLTSCEGEQVAETSFRTGVVGSEVAATDVEGKTYVLEVGEDSGANFIQPPGVGPVLQDALVDYEIDILIGVEAVGASDITLMGALGDGASPLGQSTCYPSIDFPNAGFSENPYFEVSANSFEISLGGNTFTLNNLEVNGAFAPGGSSIAGATLSGDVDTRELVPILAEGGEDDAVCEMAVPFNVYCEACADGTGDFCLSALVTNIGASEVAGLTLTAIAESETDDCDTGAN